MDDKFNTCKGEIDYSRFMVYVKNTNGKQTAEYFHLACAEQSRVKAVKDIAVEINSKQFWQEADKNEC